MLHSPMPQLSFSVRMTLTNRYVWDTSKKNWNNRKLQSQRCLFAVELTTWRFSHSDKQQCLKDPTSLVCCMYTICFIFLFFLPDKDRSPWDPLDMSTSLQRCPRQRVTNRPSCWERICFLSAPLPCMMAPNRALGMCCNLAECQIALLDWAFF